MAPDITHRRAVSRVSDALTAASAKLDDIMLTTSDDGEMGLAVAEVMRALSAQIAEEASRVRRAAS